jgi:hypothetical protein
VRVDNKYYLSEAEIVDAVQCSSRYLLIKHTKYDILSRQRGSNRGFAVVFACLRNAGLAGIVKLELEAQVMTLLSQNNNFFDPTSTEWYNNFVAKVRFVELSDQLSSRWTLDLLQSVINLHTLEVFISEGMFQLSHPDTGRFIWPDLHRLRLDDVQCHAQTLTDFLGAHKETLRDLFLQGVLFVTGSWRGNSDHG